MDTTERLAAILEQVAGDVELMDTGGEPALTSEKLTNMLEESARLQRESDGPNTLTTAERARALELLPTLEQEVVGESDDAQLARVNKASRDGNRVLLFALSLVLTSQEAHTLIRTLSTNNRVLISGIRHASGRWRSLSHVPRQHRIERYQSRQRVTIEPVNAPKIVRPYDIYSL